MGNVGPLPKIFQDSGRGGIRESFQRKEKEEVDWMETKDRGANKRIKFEKDLAAIQKKTIEAAAGKVAHHTKAEGEKLYRVRRRM